MKERITLLKSKSARLFTAGASLSVMAMLAAGPAYAQGTDAAAEEAAEREGGLDVIVVTATKREEDLQDVPVAVQALGSAELEELNVQTFDDYLTQLPNVTAGGGGPGQSTIYIRGLASTTPNLTTAGVAGLAPNVALYLDEQPVSQPGRNLDIYAADMQRVEVLSGPQGTLFGASSQAGTVRLITNKPSLGGFDAKLSTGLSFTKEGEESWNFEAMVNIPVADNFAMRAVVYVDDQGGYIDNVQGTRSTRESGRYRPEGTVRDNGVAVSGGRAGLQSGPTVAATDAALAGVTFIDADNSALVQNNFNDTRYFGFRASALWEINEDWKLTLAHARQGIRSDGVFFADPELDLDDLEIQRYTDDKIEDDFSNTAWTLEGRLGGLDIVYTGAYTERETSQRVDYSDYLFVGQYIPYYICDASAVAYGTTPVTGTCQAPELQVNSRTDTEVMTHELRVSSPAENRFRFTAGGFYSKLELRELNDFNYFGAGLINGTGGGVGFVPNFPLTNPDGAGGGSSGAGYFSDAGPFVTPTIFRNDILRTDEQLGFFGEASFDIVPDLLTVTGGLRYYDVEVDLEGSANSSFGNRSNGDPTQTDAQIFGTNLSTQFAPGNPNGFPDAAKADGFIFKGTVTVTPTEDLLFYATYSEGFRPGLLNRPVGRGNAFFTVPAELETDEVVNYEIGWKTKLFDNQLRFNGNIFYVDISNLQTTILDPSIVNLFFSTNAADAEIKGLEADFTFAPYAVPGLSVSGAFSFLDTEVTEVLIPTGDVVEGSDLAFAPDFQGNLRVRYEFPLSDSLTGHFQPQVTHSASAFTDIIEINKLQLDSWTTFDLSAGITSDNWMFEIFGKNLTDERAQVSGNFVNDRARITVNRPLTVGARVSWSY